MVNKDLVKDYLIPFKFVKIANMETNFKQPYQGDAEEENKNEPKMFKYQLGTSKLAFDGSGEVLRGKNSKRCHNNYSLCEFSTGKLYNCDLNASYNIGARYFIRETLGGMTEKSRLSVLAKVPSLIRRSTCTLSTLYDLHAAVSGVPLMSAECQMSGETKESDAPQGQPTRIVGSRKHAT